MHENRTMKEHTVIYKTWTIEDHPNKEACFDWIRNNWHDLGQFEVNEYEFLENGEFYC